LEYFQFHELLVDNAIRIKGDLQVGAYIKEWL